MVSADFEDLAKLSAGAFRALAAERLHREPSERIFDPRRDGSLGDHQLNPGSGIEVAEIPVRMAAVLVGIVMRPELTVLLTQRPDHMRSHAGQISFPGGKIEEDDASPQHAALREAREEIGLPHDLVEPLGYLDSYRTSTGFHVMPLVALVTPDFTVRPDPAEVSDVFEVPLSFLMDPANHRRDSRAWKGGRRSFYAMPYGERYIWGATAGMLRNMQERLFA
jgi:8-oxo-dGTP pyrophosphatase MutT (NUDIX family)